MSKRKTKAELQLELDSAKNNTARLQNQIESEQAENRKKTIKIQSLECQSIALLEKVNGTINVLPAPPAYIDKAGKIHQLTEGRPHVITREGELTGISVIRGTTAAELEEYQFKISEYMKVVVLERKLFEKLIDTEDFRNWRDYKKQVEEQGKDIRFLTNGAVL